MKPLQVLLSARLSRSQCSAWLSLSRSEESWQLSSKGGELVNWGRELGDFLLLAYILLEKSGRGEIQPRDLVWPGIWE